MFKIGKGYETLLDYQDLIDHFLSTKLFKTMKFVAHSKAVFDTFINNYAAGSEEIENVASREKLMSLEFVSDMLFLSDICCKLADCSKSVQLSNLLPWKYPYYVHELKRDLCSMSDEIKCLRN